MDDQERHETFRLLARAWDVDKALALIGDRPASGTIRVDQASRLLGLVRVDEEYALSDAVDLQKPVVLVSMDTACMVIDGWHRVFKALHEGVGELPAHVLSEDEERRVRIE